MERNAAQEKAIHHSSGPMMLLAGPGSGKTTTMIRRIRALLSEQHINPANILVVTFTKAAARERRAEELQAGYLRHLSRDFLRDFKTCLRPFQKQYYQ